VAVSFRRSVILLTIPICALLAMAGSDPGIVLSLDRDGFELRVRDKRDGSHGPVLRVALGSPANPTPGGVFRLRRVIMNPAWMPGPAIRARGVEPLPPGRDGPMGIAKIPFDKAPGMALHGGGIPLLLGKPITGGCIRSADADLLGLIDWLTDQGAVADGVETPEGEIHRAFRRPVWLLAH
jgi:hypothetical protein